jgi:hypothetical protein
MGQKIPNPRPPIKRNTTMSITEREKIRTKVAIAFTISEKEKTHTRFVLSARCPARIGVIAVANAETVPINPRSKYVAPKDWAKTGMKYVYMPKPREATKTEK